MDVDKLDIDERIIKKLVKDGIKELYPPQAASIGKGLLEGNNLVVAIPTASGKTLMAILAIFTTLLNNGGKAVYLSPLRALASEKFAEFREFAQEVGLKVAISTGDLDEQSRWIGNADIIIATNEKFDSLIRHQVSWLNEISVVIADEVHLINDSHRGPVLEVVLTQVRTKLPNCQIVALSATISNADEIAEWLEADLVLSDWRPVRLKEGVWFAGDVIYASGEKKRVGDKNDSTGYVSLTTEMIKDKGQVLVFANTRKSTVTTAKTLQKKVSALLSPNELQELQKLANEVRSIGEKTELRTILASVIEGGVAFHHAGLLSGHRKIVEEAFRSRLLKAISASPTLSAGINMPARRVVIRSVSRYSEGFYQPIPVLEYKQMAGRAGRPKYDPYGETIILSKNNSEQNMYLDRFVRAETELIYSKLGSEPAMRSHILSFIASEDVEDFDSAVDIIASTFYGYQNEGSLFFIEEELEKVFDILREAKLITADEPYKVTPFGKRVNELYLDPLSARMIKLGLENIDESKDLDDIIYLQLLANTPDLINYSVRKDELTKLGSIYQKYEDQWLNFDQEERTELGYDLFFSTLKIARVIQMWLDEESEEKISKEFNVASGDLHGLLNRFEWLVHSASEIAKIFKWKKPKKVLNDINKRIKYGIKKELLELVDIPNVGRVRARALFNAGYTTKTILKGASFKQVARIPGIGSRLAKIILEAVDAKGIPDTDTDSPKENIKDPIQTTLDAFFD